MSAHLPLVSRLLRAYLRSSLRGCSRTTLMLAARFPSLQEVPIQIADWSPVYMDLRHYDAHDWLKGTPWKDSPREVEEQQLLRRFVRPGDVVYDIGANIGLHAVLFSQLTGATGKVLAFEPNRELLRALAKTIAGMPNASLFPVALAEANGSAELVVVEADHSLSSLSDWTSRKENAPSLERHRLICRLQRLDDLIAEQHLPAPDFIKCDVEGGELRVFQGATVTLDRPDAPVILFEANAHTARGFGLPISAAKDHLASLTKPCYRFWQAANGRITALTIMDRVHSNILAIPEQRMSLWPDLG